MDKETERLLTEICGFLEATGMGHAYFGQQAAGNCELVKRLKRGGTVTLPIAAKVRKYMSDKRRSKKKKH